jgi:L-threonylcarbamoyladenylate synthase
VKTEIENAAEAIKKGGVILYPTDTIWGFGCDPNNETAVLKLIDIKKRDRSKSLIILVNSEAMLQRYAKIIPDVCFDLIDCATAPLTIVYPKGQFVAKEILAADGSIAIRLTKDPFCCQLMQKIKSGIVSTSANISGQPYQGDPTKMDKAMLDQIDYIVKLPLVNKNQKPSQIIKIGENSEITIIRK